MSLAEPARGGADAGVAPVRLVLPATPDSLAVVRQALTAMAEVLGLGEGVLDDLKVAVTEACTNAVVHAYPACDGGPPGPLEVHAWPHHGGIVVMVRDEGEGLSPRDARASAGLGLGLQLIATLAAEVRIASGPGRGTAIWMTFRR